MTANSMRRGARKCVWVLACIVSVGLCGRSPAWAGKLTCLTGTDPAVAVDAAQIAAMRAQVEAVCPCADYDGSPGKTHGPYMSCVGASISDGVASGHLRRQCRATVKKYYSISTCGVPASKDVVPCIRKTAAGTVSCAIKPTAQCVDSPGKYTQVRCPLFSSCIDAADTDRNAIIGPSDSGICVGDGTITDSRTGLMWEKKDAAGGLHAFNTVYTWAGQCGCASGSCSYTAPLCQPNAAAASACSAATGDALGCAQCSSGACNVDPTGNGAQTTIWDWLVQLNASNFAGYSDWRIPTSAGHATVPTGQAAELESMLAVQYPNCTISPCVSAAFNTNCTPGCSVTDCSCTQPSLYWSASTFSRTQERAFLVIFRDGFVTNADKRAVFWVRAVR